MFIIVISFSFPSSSKCQGSDVLRALRDIKEACKKKWTQRNFSSIFIDVPTTTTKKGRCYTSCPPARTGNRESIKSRAQTGTRNRKEKRRQINTLIIITNIELSTQRWKREWFPFYDSRVHGEFRWIRFFFFFFIFLHLLLFFIIMEKRLSGWWRHFKKGPRIPLVSSSDNYQSQRANTHFSRKREPGLHQQAIAMFLYIDG